MWPDRRRRTAAGEVTLSAELVAVADQLRATGARLRQIGAHPDLAPEDGGPVWAKLGEDLQLFAADVRALVVKASPERIDAVGAVLQGGGRHVS